MNSRQQLAATVRGRIADLRRSGADVGRDRPIDRELATQLRILRALDPVLAARARDLRDAGVRRFTTAATYAAGEVVRCDKGRPAGYRTMTLNL